MIKNGKIPEFTYGSGTNDPNIPRIGIKYAALIFDLPYPFNTSSSFKFKNSNVDYIGNNLNSLMLDTCDVSHWKEWLGSISWDEIDQKKAILLISKDSNTANILDIENKELEETLYNVFRFLSFLEFIQPPGIEAISISGEGAQIKSQIKLKDVRHFSKIKVWKRAFYWQDTEFAKWVANSQVKMPSINDWESLVNLSWKLLFEKKGHTQLFESFNSYEAALTGPSDLSFKIPNLIRSIEAIIALEKGKGQKEFVKRVLHLIGSMPSHFPYNVAKDCSDILSTLYELRTDCVHGKGFASTLKKNLGSSFSDKIVAKHEFVAEWSARKVLLFALTNTTLQAHLHDRDKLESYWKSHNSVIPKN